MSRDLLWCKQRIAKLEAERDEWKEQAESEAMICDIYRDERDVGRQRVDALAALCEDAAVVLERTANDTLDGRNMASRLRGAPETSLARLKAQWQAEVLDSEVVRKLLGMVEDSGDAEMWAQADAVMVRRAELRRQAEGDNQ